MTADREDRPTHRRRELPLEPAVVVGPVEEGSLLVFAGVNLGDEGAEEALHQAVADAAGHDRFLVLFVEAGAGVRLVGPDELAHALRALVATEVSR